MGTRVLGGIPYGVSPEFAALTLVAMVDFFVVVREYFYQASKTVISVIRNESMYNHTYCVGGIEPSRAPVLSLLWGGSPSSFSWSWGLDLAVALAPS